VRIAIPDALKSVLVDDWENVTKNLQLPKVPANFPVTLVLDEYVDQAQYRRMPNSPAADLLHEVVNGLKEYFNRSLGRILLYKYERAQHADILRRVEDPMDDLAAMKMGDIYGAEHLLRLFGRSIQCGAHG
jgi:mortality factor 4-like protein 1